MNKKYSILKHCKLIQSGVENYQGKKDYVATGDVINNQIIDVTPYSNENRPSRANMSVKTNDILFARMKNTTKVLRVTPKESKQIFSTGFAVLRPDIKEINPRYIMHICKSKEFQKLKTSLLMVVHKNPLTMIILQNCKFQSLHLMNKSIL